MPKKRSDDAGISQIGLFDVLDTKPPEPGAAPAHRRCETCRHWHKNVPTYDRLTGKRVESKWHHCVQLFVVSKREYGSPIESGTVLTRPEYEELMVANIDFLNTSPNFHCDKWEERKEKVA